MNTEYNRKIYQFFITMKEIQPPIWRRIQLIEESSFWDLHVAIQEVFGWTNSHMHEFYRPESAKIENEKIGIPIDDGFLDIDEIPLAGWECDISDYFLNVGNTMEYVYDFGDNWVHTIVLEGILLRPKKTKFPRCIEGERAAPPEDCGGISGYYDLLEVITNPSHKEYKEMLQWLKWTRPRKGLYDPEYFDPEKVKFSNADKLLLKLMENND